jgi:predicted metal-dependent hydrolase
MPTLMIGRTQIDYELRRSATALERRITVTPERVEVLALSADDDDAIAGFLDRKRQWVLNTMREVEQIASRRHAGLKDTFLRAAHAAHCAA